MGRIELSSKLLILVVTAVGAVVIAIWLFFSPQRFRRSLEGKTKTANVQITLTIWALLGIVLTSIVAFVLEYFYR